MREIKFRAWIKPQGLMRDIISIHFDHKEVVVDLYQDVSLSYRAFDFDDVEIMQYTGLKDKNGKEIYEGDIVQGYFNHGMQFREGAVKFSIGRFIVDGLTCVPLYEFLEGNNMNPEIIGNIHENPDLLNK